MLFNSWPILDLLATVFGSIFEVALLCIAGYFFAQKGILDKKTQKHINRINVSLFTPALLFSKVAFSLSREKLRELWIIPIVFVVTSACSMLVAYLFGTLLRLRKSQKSFAMAAAMFMNSNSLPVALMQSMVYSISLLKWGDDDTQDAMLGRALTYLVLYSTFGMLLRWSYGVHLLSQADGEEETAKQPDPEQPPTESSALLHHAAQAQTYASTRAHSSPAAIPSGTEDVFFHHKRKDSSSSVQGASSVTVAGSRPPSPPHGLHKLGSSFLTPPSRKHTKQKVFQSFPSTPIYPRSVSSSSSSSSSSDSEEDAPEQRLLPSTQPFYIRILPVILKVNSFITAPTWAALLSLIVACMPPLQHAMTEHMQPVKKALSAAGACSIPLTMIVLGAYFHVEPVEKGGLLGQLKRLMRRKNARESSLARRVRDMVEGHHLPQETGERIKGPHDSFPGETRTVVVAVVSRMILTPLVLLPLLTLLLASGATEVFSDPVFVVTNVLLMTSAPALTLAQMTQAACGDAFERLISRTIFWSYCVVTPPATVVSVVIGLLLTKL